MARHILERLQRHPHYDELVRPVSNMHPVDGQYFVWSDGILLHADGYHHPAGHVVGQALYCPDPEGSKSLFGVRYRKVYWRDGASEPRPYGDMGAILRTLDPRLDQRDRNPLPFRYEQVLPLQEFEGVICGQRTFRSACDGRLGDPKTLLADLSLASDALGIDLAAMPLGLEGAPALGTIDGYNDLDLVFHESLVENRRIADAIRDLVRAAPECRVHEAGKSWQIRFFVGDGHGGRRLICCFFVYKELDEAPLRDASMTVVSEDVALTGTVVDARHAMYTPTVVTLADVRPEGSSRGAGMPDELLLIAYHTAARGELNEGDRVWARGALVGLAPSAPAEHGLCVIEREAVRNETPPWQQYYTWPRFG